MVLSDAMSGTSSSGNQEVAHNAFDTTQSFEHKEMTKLFRYFASVKTKARTNAAKLGAAEASPAVTEQLPPPRRFLRRNRSFSVTPSGPAPERLSPCACGADGQSTCDADAVSPTNYDMILEFLMDPKAHPSP